METVIVSARAKGEYVQAIYQRYRRAARPGKQRNLDEVCAVTGHHPQHAIRVLNGPAAGATKPVRFPRHHTPVKTDGGDVPTAGFTEIALVAHCGSFGDGEFVHSLTLTDIPTTWVETAAVRGKSQAAVQAALEELRARR